MVMGTNFERGVLTVRLRRPDKRNALSRQLLAELKGEFLRWRGRDDVRVGVLVGEGDRAFASGGDVKELMTLRVESEVEMFAAESREVLDSIRQFPVPVIAALNGDALGGGAELALACDLRVASPHARIGFLQGRLAISTAWGGGTDLMRLLSTSRALKLLCGAQILTARDAMAIGLIDDILDSENSFETQVAIYAAQLAERPRHVLAAFKSLGRASREGASSAQLQTLEAKWFATTWMHQDHWDAVAKAFPGLASTP
jgi:enoyl-CoA hydratase